MKVAILSQGPDTGRWLAGRECYDTLIGVNSVPAVFPGVDWACFADYTGWRLAAAGPRVPHYFTKHDIASDIRKDRDEHTGLDSWIEYGRPNALFEVDLKPFPPLPEGVSKRVKYSGCYALWLAYHLGASEVDCFGVDLGGKTDFLGRGEPMQNCRGNGRWFRERLTWYAMCEALEREGVTVRMARMVPWQTAQAIHGSTG